MKDLYECFLKSTGISIDTRTLEEGNLFFALQGENTDGYKYIPQAMKNGASGVVYSGDKLEGIKNAFQVDDTLKTLQQLATHHRQQLGTKILALTGSNGKTTTKELLHRCLSRKFRTVSTCGNLNNHIGVPLTLLSIKPHHEFAVVEMGANHQKEIEFLCSIALPDMGFITNFGKAHLEGCGGVEGVIKGKSEMHQHLAKHDKMIFIPAWDEKQIQLTEKFDTTIVASEAGLVDAYPLLQFNFGNHVIKTHLTGDYNFFNAALAAGVAKELGVSVVDIRTAIESYIPKNNRSEIVQVGREKIILDAYNANPTSMEKALVNLAHQPESYKIAILGDMLELGDYSEQEHRDIIYMAEKLAIDGIYLIGRLFNRVPCNRCEQFKNFEDFKEQFDVKIPESCAILIKGSRGGRLERVLDLIKTQDGEKEKAT